MDGLSTFAYFRFDLIFFVAPVPPSLHTYTYAQPYLSDYVHKIRKDRHRLIDILSKWKQIWCANGSKEITKKKENKKR